MYREYCIICACKVFEDLITLHNYPICVSPTRTNPDTDIFEDLIFKTCTNCGCVQLITLTDPSVLYSQNHNNIISKSKLKSKINTLNIQLLK